MKKKKISLYTSNKGAANDWHEKKKEHTDSWKEKKVVSRECVHPRKIQGWIRLAKKEGKRDVFGSDRAKKIRENFVVADADRYEFHTVNSSSRSRDLIIEFNRVIWKFVIDEMGKSARKSHLLWLAVISLVLPKVRREFSNHSCVHLSRGSEPSRRRCCLGS